MTNLEQSFFKEDEIENKRLENDQKLKQEGAYEKEGRFTPTLQQVFRARNEMEKDLLLKEKIDQLTEIEMKANLVKADEYADEMKKIMIKNDMRPEKIRIWDSMASDNAKILENRLLQNIHDLKNSEDKDPLVKKISGIVLDDLSSTVFKKNKEITDLSSEHVLSSYILKKDSFSQEEISHIELCLNLVQMNAFRKFLKFENTDSLNETIFLQKTILMKTDNFDLDNAGFFETRFSALKSLASLILDSKTKPRYQYAHPVYFRSKESLENILLNLSNLHAYSTIKKEIL